MKFLRSIIAIISTLSFTVALAQTYPNKPISLIVPYGAGGGSDSRTRQVAQFLSQELGQPVIVDNKAGAGGNIGTEYVAKAKADGYTLGMGNFAPLSVNKALFKKLGFDPEKDLIPITLIEKGPLVLFSQAVDLIAEPVKWLNF